MTRGRHRRQSAESAPEPTAASAPDGQDQSAGVWKRFLRRWNLAKGFLSPQTILIIIVLGALTWVTFNQGFSSAFAEGKRGEPATFAWGETITTGPYEIVVRNVDTNGTCLSTTAEYPHCVIATLEVTNTTDRFVEDPIFGTHLIDAGLITLHEGDGYSPTLTRNPQISVAASGMPMGAIQPGMSATLQAQWLLAADATPCEQALEVRSAKWIRSPMDLHEHWMKDAVLGQVPVCSSTASASTTPASEAAA